MKEGVFHAMVQKLSGTISNIDSVLCYGVRLFVSTFHQHAFYALTAFTALLSLSNSAR